MTAFVGTLQAALSGAFCQRFRDPARSKLRAAILMLQAKSVRCNSSSTDEQLQGSSRLQCMAQWLIRPDQTTLLSSSARHRKVNWNLGAAAKIWAGAAASAGRRVHTPDTFSFIRYGIRTAEESYYSKMVMVMASLKIRLHAGHYSYKSWL